MSVEKFYAVRADYDDPTGAATHEFIFGTEPTVHRTVMGAGEHIQKLINDWEDDGNPPRYYIATVTRDELDALDEAEEIADD